MVLRTLGKEVYLVVTPRVHVKVSKIAEFHSPYAEKLFLGERKTNTLYLKKIILRYPLTSETHGQILHWSLGLSPKVPSRCLMAKNSGLIQMDNRSIFGTES
jgi:hypothetical protein